MGRMGKVLSCKVLLFLFFYSYIGLYYKEKDFLKKLIYFPLIVDIQYISFMCTK